MIPQPLFQVTLRRFFEPILPLLEDPDVTEIMINGPDAVFIERKGKIESTDVRFASSEALMAALRNVAQFVGRGADDKEPILEAFLPDGSRLEAILSPLAENGPFVAIRKFIREELDWKQFAASVKMPRELEQLLKKAMQQRKNIIISGGSGSGKTTLLNALASTADSNERIVVIEDTREIRLRHPHVLHLVTRPPDARGEGMVGVRDLFRASLRMRPDRIIIGEIRGEESLDLVQAMTSGHAGCLATVHATHPVDTLHRLETMALYSQVQLPLGALRSQIVSGVDLIVQVGRERSGKRAISHVSQVEPLSEQGTYHLSQLFGE